MGTEHCTVAEAAEHLSVSERTLWNWIKKGRIQAIRDDNGTRIPLSEIQKRKAPTTIPDSMILVDREAYEKLLHQMGEMGFRIGQLETEKRQLLLEDRRSWWRRWFA